MKQHSFFSVIVLAGVALLVGTGLKAQTATSSYFLDGSFTRYQLNPALTPERGYLIFPILSNFSLDVHSSVGLSNFIYESQKEPNKLTTFMSSEIDKNKFLDALPSVSRINVALNLDLLSFGFYGFNGYNTFNIKLRNTNNVLLPKELFGFMKASLADGDYLIEDINVNSMTYIELALGHSHKIGDNLTIGARFKFLGGGYYLDANVDQINARISDDSWKVRANATVKLAAPGLKPKYTVDSARPNEIDTYDFDFDGVSSFGFATDLGAVYDMSGIIKGLKLSASITDLGFINWDNMNTAATDNTEDVVFDGFDSYDVTSDEDNDEMDKLKDDFKDMMKFYDNGAKKERVALDATFRLGAEYTLPFMKWVSVGELLTTRTGKNKFIDARTSLILSPFKWLDMTGNIGFTTYGTAYGFMLNIHPAGINFFIASDCIKAKVNPQFIPMEESWVNCVFGLNIPVGTRK